LKVCAESRIVLLVRIAQDLGKGHNVTFDPVDKKLDVSNIYIETQGGQFTHSSNHSEAK